MAAADAFLLLVLGCLAVYWELVRPGRLAPGLIGCILVIAGGWLLWRNGPSGVGMALIAIAVCLFLAEIILPVDWVAGIAATAALAWGFGLLFPAPSGIPLAMAIPVSIVLGAISTVLAYSAKRARRNKRVTL